MLEVMQRFQPDVVFHAAAYKHVPLMEANPLEAVRNNAIATRVIAETAAAARRRALRADLDRQGGQPATVMGASKALAEWIVEAAGAQHPETRFVCGALRQRARLLRQRRADLPQPDRARRAGHGHPPRDDALLHDDPGGGAAGDPRRRPRRRGGEVFVLEMGEPVKIVDLARNMIRSPATSPRRTSRSSSPACGRARSSTRSCCNADEQPAADGGGADRPRRSREAPLDPEWVEASVERL